MNNYIVDASVVAKWFVEEEFSGCAAAILSDRYLLQAPDFLFLEMDSILWNWTGRDIITPSESHEIREMLRRYPIIRHPFIELLDSAYAIAVQMRQSIYDCLYVALAVLLNARMVTADRVLYSGMSQSEYARNIVWIEELP